MPKLKTHKGTAKRIKITGSGKLTRENAFKHHNLSKKSKSRKRAIKRGSLVVGAIRRNLKRALGV
jgi:large subunit ribosomal protein L35